MNEIKTKVNYWTSDYEIKVNYLEYSRIHSIAGLPMKYSTLSEYRKAIVYGFEKLLFRTSK